MVRSHKATCWATFSCASGRSIAWAYSERTLVRTLYQEDEEILPDIGTDELIIVLAIILLLFGAERIPEIARALGAGTREFRKGISQGATDGEDRKHKDQEKPPLDEADEVSHTETTQAGQKP